MQVTFGQIEAPKPAKLNKANARDVAMCRRLLAAGETQGYASGMAGIHRSSSRAQQREVEACIAQDGMENFFNRHPTNGCMIARHFILAA